MSDTGQGPDWWQAWDGKWYAPGATPPWEESAKAPPRLPGSHGTPVEPVQSAQWPPPPPPLQPTWMPAIATPPPPALPPPAVDEGASVVAFGKGDRPGGRRRRLVLASCAVVAVLIAAGASAAVVASGSGPTLDGMSAAQVLMTTLAAAKASGSAHVVLREGVAGGPTSTASVDFSASGGSGSIQLAANSTMSFVVTKGNVYIRASGAYWQDLGIMDVPASAWVYASDKDSMIGGISAIASTKYFFATILDVKGPISFVGSHSGGASVTIEGTLGLSPVGGPSESVRLKVANSSPFLPISAAAIEAQNPSLTDTLTFSKWGENISLTPPPNAISLASLGGGRQGPAPVRPASDTLAQANLQTALTGAKTYFTENSQTYRGLNPTSFGLIDTGLKSVSGSEPSTGPSVISMLAGGDGSYEVMAAWSSTGGCFAITDNTSSNKVDGVAGPATIYLELANASQAECAASKLESANPPSGWVWSTGGFFEPMPVTSNTGAIGNTGVIGNTGWTSNTGVIGNSGVPSVSIVGGNTGVSGVG